MFPIEQRAFGNADAARKGALRQASVGADFGDIDCGHRDPMNDRAHLLAASLQFTPSGRGCPS